MKHIGMLFLGMVLTFAIGCKKDNLESNTVVAEVDGKEWKAADYKATNQNGVIVVKAKDEDGKEVVVKTEDDAENTYDLEENSNFCTFTHTQGAHHFFATHPHSDKPCGKVTITHIDHGSHTVSGDFEFNAYNEDGTVVTVKNGHFTDIKYEDSDELKDYCSLFVAGVDSHPCASAAVHCGVHSDHIKIEGHCGSGDKKVTFKVPAHCQPGSYEIGPWGGASVSCDFDGGDGFNFGSFNANCGAFVVTRHDEENHVIEGEFHMTLVKFGFGGTGIEFNDGSFTVTY